MLTNILEKLTAGFFALIGISIAFYVFDLPISFPEKWWEALPDALIGVLAGWLITFVFRLENKHPKLIAWIFYPAVICFVFSFLSSFVTDYLFSTPSSLVSFFIGVVIAMAILAPDAIRNND